MRYITKRHIVKVPIDISMYYCTIHHTIIFTNSFIRKTLKLKTQLIINKDEKILKVTREPLYSISNNEKKKVESNTDNSSCVIKTNAFRNFTFVL